MSPAAVRRRHQSPQPGQHDTETETTRLHRPRSRVNNNLSGSYTSEICEMKRVRNNFSVLFHM